MALVVEELSASACAMEPHTALILKAAEDKFGGVIVDSSALPRDTSHFLRSLRQSLQHWQAQGKRGVWLKLPLDLSELMHLAIQEGFTYHHAEATYVMLVTWLPGDVASTIPANASHQVGVGAFVLNSKREACFVQNDTEFDQVVGFRQGYDAAFGRSVDEFVEQEEDLKPRKSVDKFGEQEEDLKPRKMLKKMAMKKALDLCIRMGMALGKALVMDLVMRLFVKHGYWAWLEQPQQSRVSNPGPGLFQETIIVCKREFAAGGPPVLETATLDTPSEIPTGLDFYNDFL